MLSKVSDFYKLSRLFLYPLSSEQKMYPGLLICLCSIFRFFILSDSRLVYYVFNNWVNFSEFILRRFLFNHMKFMGEI